MATLIFQRATWRLQVSRTSRNLTISFTTASPQRSNPHHQIAEPTSRHSDHHQARSSRYHQARSSRYHQVRTAYTSTRAYQSAQQVQQQKSSYPQANTRPSPAVAGTTPSRPPASNNLSTSPQEPTSSPKDASEYQDITGGLSDEPIVLDEGDRQVDWARSFHGLSTEAFPKEAADVLLQPITPDDIEVKSDGIIYLPEIKYRRILNRAFGPGGWGLAPRGETIVTAKSVTREYALVVLGRLVSVARGEQDYFSPEGIPTAAEGCKSNALMRCCKDLGVASELWDPRFIRKFMSQHIRETFVEHVVTKKRKKFWLRKDDEVKYPFKEMKYGS